MINDNYCGVVTEQGVKIVSVVIGPKDAIYEIDDSLVSLPENYLTVVDGVVCKKSDEEISAIEKTQQESRQEQSDAAQQEFNDKVLSAVQDYLNQLDGRLQTVETANNITPQPINIKTGKVTP